MIVKTIEEIIEYYTIFAIISSSSDAIIATIALHASATNIADPR